MAELEPSTYDLVIVDDPNASSMLGVPVPCLMHSESRKLGYLVFRSGRHQASLEELLRECHLKRGYYQHHKGEVYFLNGLVYWVNGPEDYELGAWYTAQYYPPAAPSCGPNFFRPLHSPAAKGWLDPLLNDTPRFSFLHR